MLFPFPQPVAGGTHPDAFLARLRNQGGPSGRERLLGSGMNESG